MFDYLSSVCREGNVEWSIGKQPDNSAFQGTLARQEDLFLEQFENKDLRLLVDQMVETAGKRKYS